MRRILVTASALVALSCQLGCPDPDKSPSDTTDATDAADTDATDTTPDTADTGDTNSPVDTADTEDTAVDPDATGSCSTLTLTGNLVPDEAGGAFKLGGDRDLGLGGPLPDAVVFEFYSDATGTFDLGKGDNANYMSCSQCVRFVQDIDTTGAQKSKNLFQKSGTITIDAATPPNGASLKVTLTDVKFVEVIIRAADFQSTEVPNGVCYQRSGPIDLETATCVPECGDHVCGPDGCGGECGRCTGGKTCALDGKSCQDSTVCTPVALVGELTNTEPGVFRLSAESVQLGAFAAPDFFQFEFYKDSTGVFTLTGGNNKNYSTCNQCLRLVVDGRTEFFQRQGTLTIDPASKPLGVPGVDGKVDLTFEGVVLEEVIIDDQFSSRPVTDGACVEIIDTHIVSKTAGP